MANRINLGGEYESEDGETRNRYWIDVSSSLMNKVNAVAIQENESPGTILAEVVEGTRELDSPEESDESDAEAAEADD